MKRLSKKVVLITVFLQLTVSVQLVTLLQFGDMLVFSQTECGIQGATSHYAIYVDHENIAGRNEGDELFHMIVRRDGSSGCTFTPLRPGITYRVDNYLDNVAVIQSKEEIIRAIETLNGNCGEWSWANTCEHIATSIRYGEAYAQCNQRGTLVGWICPLLKLLSEVEQLSGASRFVRAAAKAA